MANKKNKKKSSASKRGTAITNNASKQKGGASQITVAVPAAAAGAPITADVNKNAAQPLVDAYGTVTAAAAVEDRNDKQLCVGHGECAPGMNPPPYEVTDALGEPFIVSSSSWTGSDAPFAAVADILVKRNSQIAMTMSSKAGAAVNVGSAGGNGHLIPSAKLFGFETDAAPSSSSFGHSIIRHNTPSHASPAVRYVTGNVANADNSAGHQSTGAFSLSASSAYRLQPNTPLSVFKFMPKGDAPPFVPSQSRRVASEPAAGNSLKTVFDKNDNQQLPTPTIRVTAPSPERPRYPVKRPARSDIRSNTAPVTPTISRAAPGTGNMYEGLEQYILPDDGVVDGQNCCNCAQSHGSECTCTCHQAEDSIHSDASTVQADALPAPAVVNRAAAGLEDVVITLDAPQHFQHVTQSGKQPQDNNHNNNHFAVRHDEIRIGDIQQLARALKPSEPANVICLSKYLQGRMMRKVLTDFKLILKFPQDPYATVTFSAHKIVVGRSPYLYCRLFDRQGDPQDISEIVAHPGPRFHTPKAFEMALRTLYGTSVLDLDTLRKYTLMACGYPAKDNGNGANNLDPALMCRASMDFALCYAVSGVFFGQREIIEAGMNLAKEIMSWDTLDIVTSFCENCCQYTITPEVVVRPSIEVQDLSLDNRAAAMHGSLIQELRTFWAAKLLDSLHSFVVDNTPDDFKLYPHAHVETVFDRIPEFLRSHASVPTATSPFDSRLASLRFGSFAAANEQDTNSIEQSSAAAAAAPNQASIMVSAVIIGLPCMLLRELLFFLRDRKEHLLHRTSLLQDIVNAREARRLRALNVLAGRLVQDPALFHHPDVQILAWMESTQLSPLYDPDVPVDYTYWVVETEFVGLDLPPPPAGAAGDAAGPAPKTSSSTQNGNKNQKAAKKATKTGVKADAVAPTATNGHV